MNKNTFVISCPISCYSGYSSRSRDLVKSLIELDKYDIKILSQRWGNTRKGFIDDHLEEWGFLKDYIITKLEKQPDIWCQVSIPSEFQKVGKWNLGITAGIESTLCHHSWIEGCNKMDLVLTSSEHSKHVLSSSRFNYTNPQTQQTQVLELTTPIKVLFEGLNTNMYKILKGKDEFNNHKLYQDLNSIPEDFAYLFMGVWLPGELGEDRKNVGLLVKSFYETFKNKKLKPALILKTQGTTSSYMDKDEIEKKIKSIKNSIDSKDLPTVYLLHGDFADKEINELYNHPKIKGMVSLTKGEGFGRPLLEFASINKPIITSGWSGHIDFLKEEYTGFISGRLTPIHPSAQVKNILIPEAKWFSPDLIKTSELMEGVKSHYKEWKTKAKRQGHFIRTNFSYEKMKESLNFILKDNLPEIPVEVKFDINKFNLPKK